ncbi:MAG: glycosyl hydrolase [Fibrobacterota bacterium]
MLTGFCKALTVLMLFLASVQAEIITVGNGSYTTDLPPGKQGPTDSDNDGTPIDPSITDNIAGAVPTNGWGTSLVFQRNSDTQHSHPMFPHPLGLETQDRGLAMGYANEHYVHIPDEPGYTHLAHAIFGLPLDLVIGAEGLNSTHSMLDDYSDWTHTAAWEGHDFKVTFGQGLPFVYAETGGSDARVEATGEPQVWFEDENILGISVGTRHYALFAPQGSSWHIEDKTLTSDLLGRGYYSAAVLPAAEEDILRDYAQYAFSFVRNTEVSWEYDMENSRINTRYTVETEALEGSETGTLMALYYHQWKNTDHPLEDYTYVTPKGDMRVISGNEFTTNLTYTGILPSLPNRHSESPLYADSLLHAYISEMEELSPEELIRTNGDTYWTGKEFYRTSMLVRIADQAGRADARDYFLDILKTRLESWLTAEPGVASEIFYHDSNWGVLLGYESSFNAANGLNDHHFHYGYFITGAALIAQYDSEWAREDNWGGMVNLIIKNCVNPVRGDDFAPFLRTFDPYSGHSWASGHANFGSGNNQESSSEAVNFSSSVALWGTITGNDELRDLGAYLYTTEVEAVHSYWMDVRDEVYPDDYPKNAAGMIWGNKVDYATWFSAAPEMIRGINFLPITGGSNYLGHYPEYVRNSYAQMEEEKGEPFEHWMDVLWGFLAYGDPLRAAEEFEERKDSYNVEDGASRAHTYHHIHTLLALGQVDRNITANTPSFAVFSNDGEKTYVIYNSENREKTVSFSDGSAFTVPADTLIAFRDDQTGINDGQTRTADLNIIPQKNGIAIHGVKNIENGRITLTDIQGRTVAQRSINTEASVFLPLETTSRGIFIVRITGKNINRTQRIAVF